MWSRNIWGGCSLACRKLLGVAPKKESQTGEVCFQAVSSGCDELQVNPWEAPRGDARGRSTRLQGEREL